MKNWLKLMAAAVSAVVLTACGGGGGGGGPTSPVYVSFSMTQSNGTTALTNPIDVSTLGTTGLKIKIKFNQAIVKGTTGNVTIIGTSPTQVIPYSDDTKLAISGDTLVVSPEIVSGTTFPPKSTFIVTVDAGVVKGKDGGLSNIAVSGSTIVITTNDFDYTELAISKAFANYFAAGNITSAARNGDLLPVAASTIGTCTTADSVNFSITAAAYSNSTTATNTSGFKANGNKDCLNVFPYWAPGGANAVRLNTYSASSLTGPLTAQTSYVTQLGSTNYTGTFAAPNGSPSAPANPTWAFIGGQAAPSSGNVTPLEISLSGTVKQYVTFVIRKKIGITTAVVVEVTTVTKDNGNEVARQVDSYNFNYNGISLMAIEGYVGSDYVKLGSPGADPVPAP